MPEESGVRMYRNLKGDPDLADILVVVVTAVTGLGGDPEPFRNFLSTRKHLPPPEAFFSKPIDREEFVQKVGEVLAGGFRQLGSLRRSARPLAACSLVRS